MRIAWETRRNERGRPGSESEREEPEEPAVRRDRGSLERKNGRLSSEMLMWKRTKESGSEALVPEERSERETPVERLWERSGDGRKEAEAKEKRRR